MDCRTFRAHHVAYLDDTLPADLLVAAECHVAECPACAHHDTMVRRALMLARNVPHIECSAEFSARLQARLHEMAATERCGRALTDTCVPGAEPVRSTRRMAVAAAIVLALAAGGDAVVGRDAGPMELGMTAQPVAVPQQSAMAADPGALPEAVIDAMIASPALVTSASTGVPVWPAALLADEVPAQLLRGASGVQMAVMLR